MTDGLDDETPALTRTGGAAVRTARRVSMADVARVAGVSAQTVSRVSNGHPGVVEATRTRVLAAMAELGYRPNRLARALVGGDLRTVTALTSDTAPYRAAETLRGLVASARDTGYSLWLSFLDEETTTEETDFTALLPHPGAPVVVIAHDEATVAAARALRRIQPVSTVAAGGRGLVGVPDGADWVLGFDERADAAEATRFLLGLGHETVHHLANPLRIHRMAGWASALLDANRPVPPAVGCASTVQSGREAADPLVRDPEVTALLCDSDEVALGVLRAAREAGRDVPGSLSIVAFDDSPIADCLIPALTTVALDYRGLGRGAFELLRQRLGGDAAPDAPVWKAPRLIVRETTGPPPRR